MEIAHLFHPGDKHQQIINEIAQDLQDSSTTEETINKKLHMNQPFINVSWMLQWYEHLQHDHYQNFLHESLLHEYSILQWQSPSILHVLIQRHAQYGQQKCDEESRCVSVMNTVVQGAESIRIDGDRVAAKRLENNYRQ